MLPTKKTDAVKAQIIELYKAQPAGKKNKAAIAKKVKRSRAYVWQVLIQAKIIKRLKK